MVQHIDLRVSLETADDPDLIRLAVIRKAHLPANDVFAVEVVRRSIDARSRPPKVQLRCAIYLREDPVSEPAILSTFQMVHEAPEVLIVGAGPAGYFAALECLSIGLKPVLFDRGKDARERRRDLRAIQQFGEVDPDSNYCFGEGGAGTYSDGKLYTRSVKRGKMERVLNLLVEHGAPSDILVDAHPHIGSNKLPQVVMNIRETIQHFGGEIHFSTKVTDILIRDGAVHGLQLENGREHPGNAIMLATGHSARDIFYMLHEKGISIEFKPYALGVRIEHPQPLIDEIQYGHRDRHDLLPASSYGLACHVDGHGVFSFCMCPGGLIVPTATNPGEIVVNGMSMSRRDSPYANAGTVVSVDWGDLKHYHDKGVFAGLQFQQEVEQKLFQAGSGGQQAPAQRLPDFLAGKISQDLPGTSYIPGVYAAPLDQLLPGWITRALQTGVRDFNRKMPGYLTSEAIVVGTESRTSSPIRIPRDPITRMHPEVMGLFPVGEGAGYAGGILSAAMDGQNSAIAISNWIKDSGFQRSS
ncbi:MAG: FAD-binding protein [Saprospiraceae bacterium]|nr:FAD-binding protein [Saprospiraceae bacterium]